MSPLNYLEAEKSSVAIDAVEVVKTLSQMENSNLEELLIPEGTGNAVLRYGGSGISYSSTTTNLLRESLKTGEKAIIFQFSALKHLQSSNVIDENPFLKDINKCVNIAQKIIVELNAVKEQIADVHAGRTYVFASSQGQLPASVLTRLPAGRVETTVYQRVPSFMEKMAIRRQTSQQTPKRATKVLYSAFQLRQEFSRLSPSILRNTLFDNDFIQRLKTGSRVSGNLRTTAQKNATGNSSTGLEVISAEQLKKNQLVENLLKNMPETCYFIIDTVKQKIVVNSLQKLTVEELTLVLEKQTKMINYLKKLRTDREYAATVYEQLVENTDSFLELGLLTISGKKSKDLQVFLETLASKHIKLPLIIGWVVPYKYLDKIDKWFSTEGLLNNLKDIQDSVLKTRSFKSFGSKESMSDTVFDNVCLNFSTLIQGATFFDNIQYKRPSTTKRCKKSW